MAIVFGQQLLKGTAEAHTNDKAIQAEYKRLLQNRSERERMATYVSDSLLHPVHELMLFWIAYNRFTRPSQTG